MVSLVHGIPWGLFCISCMYEPSSNITHRLDYLVRFISDGVTTDRSVGRDIAKATTAQLIVIARLRTICKSHKDVQRQPPIK